MPCLIYAFSHASLCLVSRDHFCFFVLASTCFYITVCKQFLLIIVSRGMSQSRLLSAQALDESSSDDDDEFIIAAAQIVQSALRRKPGGSVPGRAYIHRDREAGTQDCRLFCRTSHVCPNCFSTEVMVYSFLLVSSVVFVLPMPYYYFYIAGLGCIGHYFFV
jgi:hypothetical protein